MKHTITDLENPNEPIMFSQASLENYSFDTILGNYVAEEYLILELEVESINFLIVPFLHSNKISYMFLSY